MSVPVGGTTGHCHEASAAIEQAAEWLASTPQSDRPHPIVPHLQRTCGLSAVEAVQAIREANGGQSLIDPERKKTQARERKRRQRAAEKQAASVAFIRTDASLFLHPDRLSQKAGTKKVYLRRMAIKELVDNALDAADNVTLQRQDDNIFIVTDDGPGITPAKVTELFSVTRPMISSKLIRRPTRGAVGNGLRVVTGAAFASGGSIVVASRGVAQELAFDTATGETVVAARTDSDVVNGTRVTIVFGEALPVDADTDKWGRLAIRMKGKSAMPMLTHPSWYSEAGFR